MYSIICDLFIILDMHCGINPHSSACCGPYVDAIPNHLHYTCYVSKAFKRCTEEDARSDSLCCWWWFALLFVHSIPFITVQCLPHVFTNVISAIPSHLTQSWPSLIHWHSVLPRSSQPCFSVADGSFFCEVGTVFEWPHAPTSHCKYFRATTRGALAGQGGWPLVRLWLDLNPEWIR